MSSKLHSRLGAGVGVALLGALGAVACGDDFETDCMANHTCPLPSEGGTGGEGGTPAAAGSTSEPEAGRSGGGADADPECKTAKDCDNGIPEDGAEVCGDDGECAAGNVPPTIVSVSPADQAEDVEPDAAIVITFSETLDADSVNAESIQVLDGDKPIEGVLSYADSEVTFVPAEPLVLLSTYEVSVGVGVTDAEGAALLEPHRSTLTIREGAWRAAIDAVTTDLSGQTDTLPMSADGEVLLTWQASGAPKSRAFLRGEPLGDDAIPVTNLEVAGAAAVVAGGNAAGVRAVAWQSASPGGTFVSQYRESTWGALEPKLSTSIGEAERSRLYVAPDGAITYFQSLQPGTTAWHSNASGVWSEGDVVSENLTQLSPPALAFDSAGKGLAVWRAVDDAQQSIVSSRLLSSSGKWSEAATITGGASTGPADFGRGAAPAIAMDADGNAVALWVDCKSQLDCVLKASHFSEADEAWAEPVDLTSSTLVLDPSDDAPGLVFDGTTFVGAFTATSTANVRSTYTVRYDRLAEGWDLQGKRQSAADAESARRMPRLVSDGRGHLLLVWATGLSPSFKLVYQRFSVNVWSETQTLPGGAIASKYFERGFDNWPPPALPITMNAAGMAAIAWSNYEASGALLKIRLATFE